MTPMPTGRDSDHNFLTPPPSPASPPFLGRREKNVEELFEKNSLTKTQAYLPDPSAFFTAWPEKGGKSGESGFFRPGTDGIHSDLPMTFIADWSDKGVEGGESGVFQPSIMSPPDLTDRHFSSSGPKKVVKMVKPVFSKVARVVFEAGSAHF